MKYQIKNFFRYVENNYTRIKENIITIKHNIMDDKKTLTKIAFQANKPIIDRFLLENFLIKQQAVQINNHLDFINAFFKDIINTFSLDENIPLSFNSNHFLIVKREIPLFLQLRGMSMNFSENSLFSLNMKRDDSHLNYRKYSSKYSNFLDNLENKSKKSIKNILLESEIPISNGVRGIKLFALNAIFRDPQFDLFIVDFDTATYYSLKDKIKKVFWKADNFIISSYNKRSKIADMVELYIKKEISCQKSSTADTYHFVNKEESIATKLTVNRSSLIFKIANYHDDCFVIQDSAPSRFKRMVIQQPHFILKKQIEKKNIKLDNAFNTIENTIRPFGTNNGEIRFSASIVSTRPDRFILRILKSQEQGRIKVIYDKVFNLNTSSTVLGIISETQDLYDYQLPLPRQIISQPSSVIPYDNNLFKTELWGYLRDGISHTTEIRDQYIALLNIIKEKLGQPISNNFLYEHINKLVLFLMYSLAVFLVVENDVDIPSNGSMGDQLEIRHIAHKHLESGSFIQPHLDILICDKVKLLFSMQRIRLLSILISKLTQ